MIDLYELHHENNCLHPIRVSIHVTYTHNIALYNISWYNDVWYIVNICNINAMVDILKEMLHCCTMVHFSTMVQQCTMIHFH